MKADNTYLFRAIYNDGDVYEQGTEDVSIQDESKNAYYDIFYQPFKPIDQMYRFGIVPVNPELPEYWIDFRDGRFEVNGAPFLPYPRTIKDPETEQEVGLQLRDPRLIFYRVTNANMKVSNTTGEVVGASLQVAGYILGYQANDQFGGNHQFIMRV